jgi:hypothetical protein
MTPKEKAKELVTKYRNPFNRKGCIPPTESMFPSTAKQCALIAVDEIMYNNLMEYPQHSMIYAPHKNDYWNEVKHEIQKL